MELNDRSPILDDLLDSGLKQYGQVLPPTGLETRVFANLRAEQENRVARPWPWWPTAVTVALCALAAGALFMIRKPGNGPELRIHRSAADTASQGRHTPAATNPVSAPTLSAGSKGRAGVRSRSRVAPISVEPRLEQFPSPAPLSEQEEMLVRYIRERPHEAALIARAQADLLKQDRQQFAPLLSAEPPSDSQP
jgi:hypothetical protein